MGGDRIGHGGGAPGTPLHGEGSMGSTPIRSNLVANKLPQMELIVKIQIIIIFLHHYCTSCTVIMQS